MWECKGPILKNHIQGLIKQCPNCRKKHLVLFTQKSKEVKNMVKGKECVLVKNVCVSASIKIVCPDCKYTNVRCVK